MLPPFLSRSLLLNGTVFPLSSSASSSSSSSSFLLLRSAVSKRGAAAPMTTSSSRNGSSWHQKRETNNSDRKQYQQHNHSQPKQQQQQKWRNRTIVQKDVLKIFVRSGTGGKGLPRYNGIGGCGGFVYARPDEKLNFDRFCAEFSPDNYAKNGDREEDDDKWEDEVDEEEEQKRAVTVAALDGENSRQTRLTGRHGKDRILEVPVGVEIVGENNVLLARCTTPKKPYLLARGGHGGCAENKYIPEPGESFWATVNLKLCPNLGLIGFPNAGKSTLMHALVPNKTIKIASYAFTTTRPQLCYIKYDNANNKNEIAKTIIDDDDDASDDDELSSPTATGKGNDAKEMRNDNDYEKELSEALSVVNNIKTGEERLQMLEAKKARSTAPFTLSIADLPGIVEGASRNRYNAYDCLKHLEYSDIIVMVVDVHGFQLGPNEPHRSPIEMMALLNREMEQYDRTLVRKPVVLVLNKVDVADGEQKANELCDFLLGEGRDGQWTKRLAAERGEKECLNLLPNYPINFRSVHAISAKQSRLGNVKTMLRLIHRELKSLKSAQFENDWEDWGEENPKKKGKKKRKILC